MSIYKDLELFWSFCFICGSYYWKRKITEYEADLYLSYFKLMLGHQDKRCGFYNIWVTCSTNMIGWENSRMKWLHLEYKWFGKNPNTMSQVAPSDQLRLKFSIQKINPKLYIQICYPLFDQLIIPMKSLSQFNKT